MIERSRKVVLLIDYDNLQICASRDTPGRDLQLTPVVQLAQRYGTVIFARAYAEWNLSTERLAVYKAGIEPAFAPVLRTESDRSGKSLADTVMVAEGMDMLWTLSPDVVVLATSDKDLIPLVRVAKQRGSFVVVLGSDFTAIPLREMADEHITYKQLVTDSAGRYTSEPSVARPPAALPEPARRRTRERNGRETRVAAPSPTPVSTRVEPPAPAPPPVATPAAASAAAAEPVAPVGSAAAADADGQLGTRRRRRRGSRRRSERVGQPGEAGTSLEAGAASDDAPGIDEEDEPIEAEAEVEAEAVVVEVPPAAPEVAAPDAEPEPEPAAPRERRPRRTTRRTPAAAEANAAEGAAAEAQPTAETPAAAEAAVDSAAPAAEPEPEAESANGTPARRPRRVASASRGRSRPVVR